MMLPPPLRTVTLDDEGRIAEHVPCRKCGGDLHGYPLRGQCPHCDARLDLRAEDALAIAQADAPRCTACGQSLPLQDEAERCAHCGQPVSVSLNAVRAGASPDERAVVAHDLHCRRCGYNVRGLRHDGLCPECAAPVALSQREDLLCFAEPGYVGRLACGTRWIVRATTAFIICLLANIALVLGMPNTPYVLMLLVFAGLVVALLGWLAGVWLLTTAEPNAFGPRRRDATRWRARVFLALGLASFAAEEFVVHAFAPTPVTALLRLLALALSVLGIVGVASYFLNLRRIAGRIPDWPIATQTATLAWNLAVVLGFLLLSDAIDVIVGCGPLLVPTSTRPGVTTTPVASPVPAAGLPAVSTAGRALSCITSVALLVAFLLAIRAIGLHYRLRRPLEQQATLAARHWSVARAAQDVTGNMLR